jgi:hypothetical protein
LKARRLGWISMVETLVLYRALLASKDKGKSRGVPPASRCALATGDIASSL